MPGDVHVWKAARDPAVWNVAELRELLSGDERLQALRYHHIRDHDRYIISRGLLRCLLARYLGQHPAELSIRTGPYGKPELADASAELRFNVSHSSDVVIIAITSESEIGVDVDCLTNDIKIDEIAPTVLTAHEREWMDGLPADRRREAFLAIWTCKEACLKAMGLGFSLPPTELSVSLDLGNTWATVHNGSTEWFIQRFEAADDCLGAFTLRLRESNVTYWSI